METYRSSLELGKPYPVDISSIESDYLKVYPISPISDKFSPLVFSIDSTSGHYIQFSDSFIYLRLKILNGNGGTLTATDTAAGSHDLLSSIFSGIEIDQNGSLVSTTATLYPYRSHIMKMIGYDYGYKATLAQEELWYPDDRQDKFDTSNKGYVKRLAMASLSKPFEICGRLSESIFEQERYFPPGVTTRILLRRSPPEFCIDSDKAMTFSYEILSAVFYVRRHLINPEIVAYHQQLLSNNEKFQYPLDHFIVRAFNIKETTSSVISEPLFRGRVPSYIIISFVLTEAFQGKFSKQCFNLQNLGVSQITAKVDGEAKVYESLQFDFTESQNQFILGYNTLKSALPTGKNHGITLDDYKASNFLVCLGLNPNTAIQTNSIQKEGAVQVDINFKEALANAVTCIVIGKFEANLEIDKNYSVTVK